LDDEFPVPAIFTAFTRKTCGNPLVRPAIVAVVAVDTPSSKTSQLSPLSEEYSTT
jgi:hypothetical protein